MSVKSLLAAIVLSLSPQHPCDKCEISNDGLQIVRTFEGYSPVIYKDPAGLDTIGYGHLIKPGESFNILLPEDANMLLKRDMAATESAVNRFVVVTLWQGQFDALASFTFNLGGGTLQHSTLLRRVNAQQHDLVPPQINRYVNVNGIPVRGLVLRREMESELYRKSTRKRPR